MEWISVNDRLPEELKAVWACNIETKFVTIACLTYSDGWLWAVTNGSIYSENSKIVSECELDDEYDFTHWLPLPDLPI